MTFQQLQYILEVSRTGSVSNAAKKLFLSPSSVSVAVSGLEEELGFPIFVRQQKGFTPTVQGEKALEYAKRILDAYKLMNKLDSGTPKGVRISCSDYGAFNRAFTKLVTEFQPKDLSLLNLPKEEVMQKLLVGDMDLGILHCFESRLRAMYSQFERYNLKWETLGSVPAAARVGVGHPLYNEPLLTPAQLEPFTLVETSQRRISNSTALKGYISLDPERIICCDTQGGRRQLVANGLAYEILPKMPGTTLHGIRLIPIRGITYHILAYYNPRFQRKPEITKFLELVKAELEQG